MDLVKRFLKYVSFDTQSDEYSDTTPSTLKQLELGKYLVNELKSIGLKDAFLDEYGIVYATLLKNSDKKFDTIGLIAHMDTAPDCSGKDIKPRIITNYDGSDIILNEDTIMKVDEFPSLKENIGEDLIVTDGTTLLGADDKAGIAIIIEAIYRLINSKVEHGDIKIAFTPDEEVGRGVDHFDVKFFNADFAYTLDGGDISFIEDECFTAYKATVNIKGVSIHPGSAKGKMVNSTLLAQEFINLLPENETPEKTDNYEGFQHLCDISGDCENTKIHYILREFSDKMMERKIKIFKEAAEKINKKYNNEFVTITFKEQYRNMKEVLDNYPNVLRKIERAYKSNDIEYSYLPIRGGTDGARLSFLGLPCPNLGDGGYNFHGRYEYVSITQMQKMVKIIISILTEQEKK